MNTLNLSLMISLQKNVPPACAYYNIKKRFSVTIEEMLRYLISLFFMKNKIKHEVNHASLRPISAGLPAPESTTLCTHTGCSPEITFKEKVGVVLNYSRDRINTNNILSNSLKKRL